MCYTFIIFKFCGIIKYEKRDLFTNPNTKASRTYMLVYDNLRRDVLQSA